MEDLDEIKERAKVLAEATGRSEEDVLADLLDDGVLNESNKESKDLVSQLKEAAALITTVQSINKEVSENKVLNGGDNKTEVAIETTLEGDIVDRAIESAQRKAENIKKLVATLLPLVLLVGGGGSLEMFGVTDFVGSEDDGEYHDDTYVEYWGCTDWNADNYDEYANMDDGSCSYPVYGCTNDAAPNYNSDATVDDGSCEPNPPPPRPGCTDPEADNYDEEAQQDDGSCEYPPDPILGCTDSEADNYDDEATEDDGSCEYPPEPVYGCTDDSANNYNPEATEDDESCEYDPEPECEVEIHNHYRGHVADDDEQDAILVAFRVQPIDCEGETIEIDIDMHPPGEDDEVNYHHYITVSGDNDTVVSHVFDHVAVGVWVPRITAIIDDEQLERVWFWSIEVVEQTCEINLYGINIGTNNTSAVVFYDLDCGTEQNDLDGYNVSVQFLVYAVNSTDDPIEYNTSLHYIEGYEDDTQMLRLSNFTDGNTTHYDFYWYAIWEDADGEQQFIERKWLNRELSP